MKQYLKNNLLSIEIDSHGAELQSIVDNATGRQYLWQGDSKFWGRRSPVLFPLVGKAFDCRYRLDGKEYVLGQHGFARDRDFVAVDCEADDEAWFAYESDDNDLGLYPRRFRLEVGYRLQGERLEVMWRVYNKDDKPMPFHIGAHPAFNYPDFNESDPVHAYLIFGATELSSQMLMSDGCIGTERYAVEIDSEGMMPVVKDTFRHNTLILDDARIRRVSMLDKERRPYLTVLFNAPLVGIWSPGHDAPFICLEPWYGRSDRQGFEGDFFGREYVNILQPGETFETSYTVIFETV